MDKEAAKAEGGTPAPRGVHTLLSTGHKIHRFLLALSNVGRDIDIVRHAIDTESTHRQFYPLSYKKFNPQ